jgi:rhodanese-related sulfurtransferase
MTIARNSHVDPAELQRLLASDNPPWLLDVRTPAEYASAHIPGSYNVPLDTLREHREELQRHLDTDVVLVCRSGARARHAEEVLAATGLRGISVLSGGMVGWESAGAPVNRGHDRWDIERQVRFAAGSLVLGGVLGSIAVPRLKWLAGAIGAGLVFAGVTGTCGMGMLLARMPWNRDRSYDIDVVLTALAEGR